MWKLLRKANGKCGNCGAKTLKVDTISYNLICQSCGATNKSGGVSNVIGLFLIITLNTFIFDKISYPYNWLILIFAIFPIILFIQSEFRKKVIAKSDEEE